MLFDFISYTLPSDSKPNLEVPVITTRQENFRPEVKTYDLGEVPSITISGNPSADGTKDYTPKSTVSVSDSFESLIKKYWNDGKPIDIDYSMGGVPLYQILYDKGIISTAVYNHKKNQGPRSANANYGAKNSNHKEGFINIPGGGRTLHAYDFTPKSGGFMKTLDQIYSDPEMVNYMLIHNIGLIEEFYEKGGIRGGKFGWRRTGDHFHGGPDALARAMTIVRLKEKGYPVPDYIYKQAYKVAWHV